MVDIQEIKEQFPNPKKCSSHPSQHEEGDYCIGGAIVNYAYRANVLDSLVGPENFPLNSELEKALLGLNPKLNPLDAEIFASKITKRNDLEQFDLAWKVAEEALRKKY